MRALGLLLLLGACDRVFGLGDPYEDAAGGGSADAQPGDASVDAMRDAPADATDKIPMPLLHYRFDGDYTEAGGGAVATCTTSTGGVCSFVSGKYGSALNLDGSSIGQITLPSLPPSFTLMLWIGTASGPAIDLGKTLSSPTSDVWWLDVGNGVAFQTISGTSVQLTSSPRPLEQWTNIAVTYDGAHQIIYLDGIAAAQTAVGAISYGTNRVVCVGCRQTQTTHTFFAGTIDDVYVFSSALTQAEIGAYAGSAH